MNGEGRWKEVLIEWVKNGVIAIIAGLTSAVVYLFHLLVECYANSP